MHECEEKRAGVDDDGWLVVESLQGFGDGSEGVDQYSSHHLHEAEQPHHQISFGIDFELGQRVVDLLLTHCRIYTSTVS